MKHVINMIIMKHVINMHEDHETCDYHEMPCPSGCGPGKLLVTWLFEFGRALQSELALSCCCYRKSESRSWRNWVKVNCRLLSSQVQL